jgi:hypothetical protein
MRANPGVKVWCAGHDLSELDPGALDAQNPERGFGEVLYVKE